jgi:hypothetical protein
MKDMKIIHGGDIVGSFPDGFRINFSVTPRYLQRVASFAIRRVREGGGAVHIFVVEKRASDFVLELLTSKSVNCAFVSSDTQAEELKTVASKWGKGEFDILISTSIALVENENPLCRFIACAGYLFDAMQVVQGFGRLRQYMRSNIGQIFFAAPEALSKKRTEDDEGRFTRLLNENLLSEEDKALFRATMTSGGVRDWIMDATLGNKGCALKMLSNSFGKSREDCGACPCCRSIPALNVQAEAVLRMDKVRRYEQATERVLRKLALVCLACKVVGCRGIPILKEKGSKFLPDNRACCFSWKNCYQCGVSQHDRKACFDRKYMNHIACCECWVFKNVPGAKRHEVTDCEVKGRLRRLLPHHYIKSKVTSTFKDYLDGIYTSSETFCGFMATMEATYMSDEVPSI